MIRVSPGQQVFLISKALTPWPNFVLQNSLTDGEELELLGSVFSSGSQSMVHKAGGLGVSSGHQLEMHPPQTSWIRNWEWWREQVVICISASSPRNSDAHSSLRTTDTVSVLWMKCKLCKHFFFLLSELFERLLKDSPTKSFTDKLSVGKLITGWLVPRFVCKVRHFCHNDFVSSILEAMGKNMKYFLTMFLP